MLLRDGAAVASGLTRQVLTDANLSGTFGLPIHVWRRDGRWHARAA
jgi:iron complex transport system ATP-binding protein